MSILLWEVYAIIAFVATYKLVLWLGRRRNNR